jgi:hypothetical protein
MGEPRGPHHGVGGHRHDTVWPCDGGPRRRPVFLDGAMFGARRMGFRAGLDAVERCGAPGRFIQGGAASRGGGAEESVAVGGV